MRPAYKSCLFSILILVALSQPMVAQSSLASVVGVPPDSTVYPIAGLGFVNLGSGNLHLEIPLTEVRERNSATQTTSIVYDSHVYQIDQLPSTPNQAGQFYWAVFPDQGPNVWGTHLGVQTLPNHVDSVRYTTAPGFCGSNMITVYSNFQYTDPQGTIHPFSSSLFTEQAPASLGCLDQPNAQATAIDGSGYWISVTSYNHYVVYDLHGNEVNNDTDSIGAVDSNGNRIPPGKGDVLGRNLGTGYTLTLKTINVWTQFNSGSTLELGPTSGQVISAVTLPDGRAYSFQYDEAGSPAQQGHYGNLTGITLPTGGHITISNQLQLCGGNPGLIVSQITTPDGTWNVSGGNGCIVTVTAPPDLYTGLASQTTCNCAPGLTKTLKVYAGAASGSPLRTVTTQVNSFRPSSITTTLENGQSSHVDYTYADACTPRIATKKEYDFSGSLVRETDITYPTTAADNGRLCGIWNTPPPWDSIYLKNNHHIIDIPFSVTVYGASGSSGAAVAKTNYTYDSTALSTTSGSLGTSVLGLSVHDDAHFGASMTVRGNPTVISQMKSSGTFITTKTNYYNILGELVKSTDGNGNITNFDFTDSWNDASCISSPVFAYPTTVTDALSHQTKTKYNSCDGSVASLQNQNDLSASRAGTVYTYDSRRRVTNVSYPDGGNTATNYGGSANPQVITTTVTATPRPSIASSVTLDGVGRVSQTAGPAAGVTSETTYDALGRVYSVTNPHFSSASTTDGTTFPRYDPLGRTILITEPDGSVVTTSYSGNCATVTDEAPKTRKSCSDALGRVTQLFEDPSGVNYETDYQYDPLNNLIRDDQKGTSPSNSANWRTRIFLYDSLSRLLTATNPESGAINYTYDNSSNVLTKMAPKPNQTGSLTVTTTYSYDVLNRLTKKTYDDGSTATVQYAYDGVNPTGCTPPAITSPTNLIGARSGMCDASGATAWSYDPRGRVTVQQRLIGTTSKTVRNNYYPDGVVNGLFYPSGNALVSRIDGAGRIFGVVDSVNNYVFGNASFAPNGALTSMWQGNGAGFNGIFSLFAYNQRFQPALEYSVTAGPTQVLFKRCYDYHAHGGVNISVGGVTCTFNGTTPGDNGNVYQIANKVDDTRTQNFFYDSLNRVQQAYTNGPNWGEQFTIDAWGNLTNISAVTGKTLPGGLNAAPATVKNQLTGYSYDAAGNLLSDGLGNNFTYDAENRISTASGVSYSYDGGGTRVKKSSGTLYWTDKDSNVLAESDVSGNITAEYIFFNGMRTSRVDRPSGKVHHFLVDHLGSARMMVTPSGLNTVTVEQDLDYTPYGTLASGSAADHYEFTGKERDAESGLDNFGARYNTSNMGRFMSPDPLGGSRFNPQSLNKYAYTRNNPLRFVDPTGLYDVDANCAKDKKCAGEAARFEQARQQDLKSNDSAVRSAAGAYGDPGKANGVTVNFGDKKTVEATCGAGAAGCTQGGFTADANGKVSPDVNVLIRTGLGETDLQRNTAHEGSHVEDDLSFINSFDVSSLSFDSARNFARYDTEFKAYAIGNAVGSDAYSIGKCGSDPCVFRPGASPGETYGTIDRMLTDPSSSYRAKGLDVLIYDPSMTKPR